MRTYIEPVFTLKNSNIFGKGTKFPLKKPPIAPILTPPKEDRPTKFGGPLKFGGTPAKKGHVTLKLNTTWDPDDITRLTTRSNSQEDWRRRPMRNEEKMRKFMEQFVVVKMKKMLRNERDVDEIGNGDDVDEKFDPGRELREKKRSRREKDDIE